MRGKPPRPALAYSRGMAAAVLALHLAVADRYGFFRDELYFIDCGLHPDWGYADQPPLVPLLAGAMHRWWPGSLFMLRLWPALAHAGLVLLTAETARVLGGRAFAQALAALSVATAPVFLGMGSLLVTDLLQPLSWLFVAYALLRLKSGGGTAWWFAIAIVASVSLWSKYLLVFWLLALLLGLLLTPERRLLADRSPWLAMALTLILVAPNVLWQARHDFPFLQLGTYTVVQKNVPLSPWSFLLAAVRDLNLPTLPLWLTGLATLGLAGSTRALALAAVGVVAAMIGLHGKPYYAAGVFPVLMAAGAVAFAGWIGSRIVRGVMVAGIAGFGALALPLAIPLLPPDQLLQYQTALGLTPRVYQAGPHALLPQHFADQFGWPELAAMVAQAAQTLSPEDRAKLVFLAENYGEAGAIDVLGPGLGAPQAISGHNQYWLWGPRGHDGSVVLRFGGSRAALLKNYGSVTLVGEFQSRWAMPWEIGKPLWLCRDRKRPFESDWASFRHYD